MVKIYSIQIIRRDSDKAVQLCAVFDINSLCSFFQRRSYQEFITLFSKTIVQRTHPTARQSIKEGEYMCYVFVRVDNLAGVVITDHEYPSRVAHALLTKILNDFDSSISAEIWTKHSTGDISFPQLSPLMAQYQNPMECDPLTKIQNELSETKIVLHNTMQAVLERGEKLEDLVSKSEELSMTSKIFFETAKRNNRCCNF